MGNSLKKRTIEVHGHLRITAGQYSDINKRRRDSPSHYFKKAIVQPWIIERLDRKLADAIGSNIVEKCDVTLSRAIQPLTYDVLRVLFFIAYFFIYISLSSTIRIAHVLK